MTLSATDRDEREGHHGDNFIRLAPDRFFVRGLLPVRLSDGHEFHFGVWVETSAETCAELMNIWDEPEYGPTEFAGRLANAVPPWGEILLDKPCHVQVRDRAQLPYVKTSTDASLESVLTSPWPREECEALVADVWDRPGSRG